MNKKMTLFVTGLEPVHLYKDVILLPYYLKKEYNLDFEVVYTSEKDNLPKKFRDISLTKVKFYNEKGIIKKWDRYRIITWFSFYKYLLKNAKNINYLMFFHLRYEKLPLVMLYKFLNKKGKVYLKFDSSYNSILRRTKYKFLKKLRYKFLLKKLDLISCEEKASYEFLQSNLLCGMDISKKIVYLPNGFDEENIKEKNIKIKNFEEKENIMITVGRLGTEVKNTEMLLKSLENIDLKDWKIYLIGPYTEEFKKYYKDYILKYPEKKEKVILVGNIENKAELYDYYNRAKVFILTSRKESSANVYSEALRFGNYILSTKVGGSLDITDNGKIGQLVEVEDNISLTKIIQNIVVNKIDLKSNYDIALKLSKEKFIWENIVKTERFLNFFEENNER